MIKTPKKLIVQAIKEVVLGGVRQSINFMKDYIFRKTMIVMIRKIELIIYRYILD